MNPLQPPAAVGGGVGGGDGGRPRAGVAKGRVPVSITLHDAGNQQTHTTLWESVRDSVT